MTPALSTYLELVRVVATLIVFVSHSSALYEPLAKLAWLDKFGRDGVIVFFVLSGYVISWCASERDRSPVEFAVNRASRIYSVAAPGLVLALGVTWLLYGAGHTQTLDYSLHKPWIYLPIYLGFAGNFWYLNETPPNNFPYWSLYCEVWYYIMFAAFFYLRGVWRWLSLSLLAALIGPQMLQLGLLWLAGSLLYFHGHQLALSQLAARVLCVSTVGAYVATKLLGVDDFLDSFIAPVWMAVAGSVEHAPDQRFGDYWIGLLVCLNILAAKGANWQMRAGTERVIRIIAAYSFSTYLFHIPLFSLLKALLNDRQSLLQFLMAVILCVVGIVAMAQVSEHRKSAWRRFFNSLAMRLPHAAHRPHLNPERPA